MAIAQSSGVIKKLINLLRLSPASEEIPKRVGNIILPVLVTNPDPDTQIALTNQSAGNTDTTLLTTSLTEDTFLQSVSTHIAQAVSGTQVATTVEVIVTKFGTVTAVQLGQISGDRSISGSGMSQSVFLGERGLKLARGSNIIINRGTSNDAGTLTTGTIVGYTQLKSD